MIISEKSKKREIRHKNVVHSLESSFKSSNNCSKYVACSSDLLRRESIFCYSVMLFCKDNSAVGENQEGAKGDTVPVTYHRPKTLISQFHYIATRKIQRGSNGKDIYAGYIC